MQRLKRRKARDSIAIVEELGGVVKSVERRHGPHMAMHVEYKGVEFKYFIPNSVSDHRAILNRTSDLRRMFKAIDEGKSPCLK